MSKTVHTLYSPDEHKFLYFDEGVFLNYHPIDLKIDRINCYHSFAISKRNPLLLYSRNTSCFCEGCKLGNFTSCIDIGFHGTWHVNLLDITPVVRIPDVIHLAVTMQAHLQELRTSFTKPFLVIFYEHKSIVRPTYACSHPTSSKLQPCDSWGTCS